MPEMNVLSLACKMNKGNTDLPPRRAICLPTLDSPVGSTAITTK